MKLVLSLLLASFLLTPATLAAEEPKPAQTPTPADDEPAKVEMNELEKKFEKTMSGCALVGRFSTHGKEDQLPKEDRYVISKVSKIGPNLWLFTAQVGKAKLPLPIPVPVKWAGDTPMISMTKLTIPTMGTFSARVLFYDNYYAGTWDAGDHGGHMWGRIDRADQAAPADAPAPTDKPADKPKP